MTNLFFFPKTIAVIGATANPKKFGNAVTINILKNKNLQSELFLISPRNQEIYGLKTHNSVFNVPKDIDLAIILVPAGIVESVVDQCIEKKVKRIIIVSAGFGEIDEKGKKIEAEIAKKCKEAGIRVMGPNCVGIQNIDIGLNASFIKSAPKGNIGMISQSGSFGCACFYEMERHDLGCSKFANIGNNIDVSFGEILDFFKEDENTQIICIYLETITDGKTFYEIIKDIIPLKPIIALKGGRTTSGMKAASSHTGSMATDYKMLKTAIKQAGAVMCENVSDYITAIRTFSFLPLPKGEKIGVLTNSGGSSVLFSDKAEEFGLKLAEFSEELKKKMSLHLISLVKMVNPLDMIGVAEEEQYYNITKAMLEDPGIDMVVACIVIPPFLEMKSDEHYRGIIRAWNDTGRGKPVIPLIMFSEGFQNLKDLAKKEKTTIYFTPHEAAYACFLLIDRMKILQLNK